MGSERVRAIHGEYIYLSIGDHDGSDQLICQVLMYFRSGGDVLCG